MATTPPQSDAERRALLDLDAAARLVAGDTWDTMRAALATRASELGVQAERH